MISIATYVDFVDELGNKQFSCYTSVDTFWPAFFFVGSISVFFLLPLLVLLVLYSIIAKNLMENPGIILTHAQNSNRNNVLKYRKQVIFMLGTVVLSFFICLLPFRAFTLWIIIVPQETIESLSIEGYYNILAFCRIMLYLNSAINPILYNLMSSKFRDGFLLLLGCQTILRRRKLRTGVRTGTFHTTSTNLSSSQSHSERRLNNSRRNCRLDSKSSIKSSPLKHEQKEYNNGNVVIAEIDETLCENGNNRVKLMPNTASRRTISFDDKIERTQQKLIDKLNVHLSDNDDNKITEERIISSSNAASNIDVYTDQLNKIRIFYGDKESDV